LRSIFSLFVAALTALTVAVGGRTVMAEGLIEEVLDRGYVKCAIGNRPVFDTRIGDSGYEGFFPEFCRAIALALFGDRDTVEMSPTLIRHGLQSIAERDVDVYISNVTWTFSRDMAMKLTPAVVLYYDGQGFLSHKGTVGGALTDLKKAKVCVSHSTTTLANLQDYIKQHGLDWEPVPFSSSQGRNDAFFARRCDLVTTDRLALATMRIAAVDDPENYVLHDEVISKEPLVAYVNAGDMMWGNLVRWVFLATVIAEEKGIARDTVAQHLNSTDPTVRRLLGVDETDGAAAAGLEPDWARRVIAGAGNYGEIFDRYLGKDSDMKIGRGANKLFRDGGLIYSPPFR